MTKGLCKRALAICLILSSLTACESVTDLWDDKWFGETDKPLEGKRYAVLSSSRTLTADPSLADNRILLPAPTPNAAWPQSGGYANHAMHHIAINPSIKPAWETNIGSGSDDEEKLLSQPVVAAGLVFAMDSANVVSAYSAENGAEVWARDLTDNDEDDGFFGGGVAYDNGTLFVSTGFAQVFALDARNGKLKWKKLLSGAMRAAPTVRGNRVFVTTADNKLFALSAFTGEELWKYEGFSETASLLGSSSPAVDQGVVVATFTSGEIVGVRVENGKRLWADSLAALRRSDAALAHIRGRPVIDRGLAIAVSNSGMMVAIDLRTGRRVWEREIASMENPWIAGNYIFSLTNEAEIVCISRKTGKVHWVQALPRYERPEKLKDVILWTGPVLASDRLIVAGSHGIALAISPYTGKILGQVEMPDGVTIPPVISQKTIYFLADDASLIAYR